MHPGSLLAHRDHGKIQEGRGTRAGAARAPLIPRPGDRQDVLKSQPKKSRESPGFCRPRAGAGGGLWKMSAFGMGRSPQKPLVSESPRWEGADLAPPPPKNRRDKFGGVCSRLHRDPSESQLGLTPPLRAHTAAGGAFPLKPPPKISNSQASSSSSAGPAGSGGRGGFLGSPGESFTSVSPQERGPPPGALRSDSSPNGSDMDRR